MDRTLREHIDSLEQKLLLLSTQVMEEAGDLKARNELVAELRAVESALALYRSAFEVELRITNVSLQVPAAS